VVECIKATGEIRIAFRVGGGAVAGNPFSGALTPAAAWDGEKIMLRTSGTAYRAVRHHTVQLADLDSATDGSEEEALIAEMAAYDYLTAPES